MNAAVDRPEDDLALGGEARSKTEEFYCVDVGLIARRAPKIIIPTVTKKKKGITICVGFENSYIVDLPPQLGIRETRRVVGGYMLSGEDVLGCASFEDSIGVNGWPMEQHVAGDVVFKFPPIPELRGFNELPYRMLVPEGVDNLLMAGRCASMTHEGQSAARVSGACFAMGEAVGAAADLALSGNTIPRDIAVEKLQQTLKQQGAFIGRDQRVPDGL